MTLRVTRQKGLEHTVTQIMPTEQEFKFQLLPTSLTAELYLLLKEDSSCIELITSRITLSSASLTSLVLPILSQRP